MNKDDEQVLAFPAYMLNRLGIKDGFTRLADGVAEKLLEVAIFIRRGDAEKDPRWLQVIPYIVMRQGHKVLVYRRTTKGGESRLHHKWSLGVGGHVNQEDGEEPA